MPFRRTYLKYDPENRDNHITASISGTGQIFGGVFSSRQAMNIVDSKGVEKKGFFTADSVVDNKNAFETHITKTRTNWDDYRPLLHGIRTSDRTFRSIIEDLEELHITDESDLRQNAIDLENAIRNGNEDEKARIREQGKPVISFFNRLCGRDDLQDLYQDDPDFWRALGDAYGSIRKANKDNKTRISHQRLNGGTSINLRNNAMSDYAGLIGMPDLLAHSVPMTLIRDGIVTEGTFMDNAKGVSHQSISVSNPDFVYKDDPDSNEEPTPKTVEMTGDCVRELSNMQVLDYLCANMDRHWENMFYKFDFSDPHKAKLTGIQGIDNDASFGLVDHQGDGIYDRMSKLNDIKVIDDDTARRVLNLKPEQMEEKIRLAGLSADEVRKARERLTDLQNRITAGSIKRISTQAEWDSYARPDRYNTLVSTAEDHKSSGKIRHTENVFGVARKTVNDFNLGHPDYAAPEAINTDAHLIEENDKYKLWNRLDRMHTLRDNINKASLTIRNDPQLGIAPVMAQLNKTEETMSKFSGDNELDEAANAEIVGELTKLSQATDTFFLKPPEEAIRRMNNAQKSSYLSTLSALKDLSSFAKESVRRLGPQSENVLNEPELHSDHTYDSLHARVGSVTSIFRGASKEFADLRHALEKVKDIDSDDSVTPERKRELYDDLADCAEKYLDYKIPNNNTNGLSNFAKSRVQFARDVLDFAEARLDPLVKSEAQAALVPTRDVEAEKQKNDPNPYTPVINGVGTALEYNPETGTFERFDNTDMTPRQEYFARMSLREREGQTVTESEKNDLINAIAEQNPGKDIDRILDEYNRSSDRASKDILTDRLARMSDFDRNRGREMTDGQRKAVQTAANILPDEIERMKELGIDARSRDEMILGSPDDPHMPVVKGEGDALEYNKLTGEFVRFDKTAMNPMDEYMKRVSISEYNGGEVPFEVRSRILNSKLGKDPEKNPNDLFAEINSASEKEVEKLLGSYTEKATELINQKAEKEANGIKDEADGLEEETELEYAEAMTEEELENALNVPEEEEEIPQRAGAMTEEEINGINSLDTIEEDLEAEDEAERDEAKSRYDRAYDTIISEQYSPDDYLDAVMTVMATHELNRYERDNQILSKEEQDKRTEYAKLREEIKSDPDKFERFKSDLWEKTRRGIEGTEQDYIHSAASKLREANANKGNDPEARFNAEEDLAEERDANLKQRTIHEKGDDFDKGMQVIEAQRKHAYGLLLSGQVSPQAKDEARITLATCHHLVGESEMGKTANAMWSGKRSPDNYSLDGIKAINKYIDTVKEVGKDPKQFLKLREETRKELAPYFSNTNNIARDRMKEPERDCVKKQFSNTSPLSKYAAEHKLVGGIESYSAQMKCAPGQVEMYLERCKAKQKGKAYGQNKPQPNKAKVKDEPKKTEPEVNKNEIKEDSPMIGGF